MSTPSELDVSDVLTRQRIASAFAALNDSSGEGGAVRLDQSEREAITTAIQRSDHHLGGFARNVLDQWDQLETDEQVAGLLLFAEIAGQPHRKRDRGLER